MIAQLSLCLKAFMIDDVLVHFSFLPCLSDHSSGLFWGPFQDRKLNSGCVLKEKICFCLNVDAVAVSVLPRIEFKSQFQCKYSFLN